MGEIRECKIMVNLEPTFNDALNRLINQTRESASSYTRRLIIKDLRERGLLTDDMIMDVTVR
jgi:hypothetical protein